MVQVSKDRTNVVKDRKELAFKEVALMQIKEAIKNISKNTFLF